MLSPETILGNVLRREQKYGRPKAAGQLERQSAMIGGENVITPAAIASRGADKFATRQGRTGQIRQNREETP